MWAPQTIYDREAGKYMVYWSMQHGNGPDIIYYAYANKDFTDIEGEPKPLFLPETKNHVLTATLFTKMDSIICSTKRKGMEMELKRPLPPL